MIKFCAQMEIDKSRDHIWQTLMRELPESYRRPGKVDLTALDAEMAQKNPSSEESPSIPSKSWNKFPDVEILDWKEGRAFVIRFSQQPYLKSVVADVWLKDTGGWEGSTQANIRLELKLGCWLTPPASLIYWLFQKQINRFILQSLVGMRYEIETGNILEADQEFKLPLDRIEKVRCK